MAGVTFVNTMSEADSSLVSKCMEYTKQLANQGREFKFSLSLPSGFSFSLDYIQEKTSPKNLEKKKKSPSTLRRNAQRRKIFVDKKAKDKQAEEQLVHPPPKSLNTKKKCDNCEDMFEDSACLKRHMANKHQETLTCEECPYTTQSKRYLKDHKIKEHDIPQLDGNQALVEEEDAEDHDPVSSALNSIDFASIVANAMK